MMMTEIGCYTSGRIAVANLSASIATLEVTRAGAHCFDDLLALSKLLFLRGDLLGRIADHDRGELVANEAVASSCDTGSALYLRAQLAGRFHRFAEADQLLDQLLTTDYSKQEIETERASLFQATGKYRQALALREKLADEDPGIDTIGALASLFSEMDQWPRAEVCYEAALAADDGTSPIPCGQLLFEWGVSAMRRGDLSRAETILTELDTILPQHVPGRGHRAEVALARDELAIAEELVRPLLEIADDPEYRAIYAEILTARGDRKAAREVARAAAGYELLLARRPEAYADHGAAFFMGVGNRPQLALELASSNFKLRDTPRSRSLLERAGRKAKQASMQERAA